MTGQLHKLKEEILMRKVPADILHLYLAELRNHISPDEFKGLIDLLENTTNNSKSQSLKKKTLEKQDQIKSNSSNGVSSQQT